MQKTAQIAGVGRKRPQLNIAVEQLHLDTKNPRLMEESQGGKELALINVLYRDFNLDELAESMSRNGYFDEEPLVAVPKKTPKDMTIGDMTSEQFIKFIEREDTEFTVVEGNRRLATVKLLLDSSLRDSLRIKSWEPISDEVAVDLKSLPVIIYRERNEVIPYLGVRHIVGIQKWDSYAKARYIASMVESGFTPQEVQAQIGDKQGAVIKNYVCYKILDQLENEFTLEMKSAKESFSLLLLAVGQGNIKRFLGLPVKLNSVNFEEPIPQKNLENSRKFIEWVFGAGPVLPVISDSRDITRYLSHVLANQEAIDYLYKTRDLKGAYERSSGEQNLVLRSIATANSKLESVLGIAHRHKTQDAISETEKCVQTAIQLEKTLKAKSDD
ncbi:MAG: hypothetical protein HC853_04795 [Anaerolineae bacterium]|nr:hypothetical protein [Anaerolineae bacterium]